MTTTVITTTKTFIFFDTENKMRLINNLDGRKRMRHLLWTKSSCSEFKLVWLSKTQQTAAEWRLRWKQENASTGPLWSSWSMSHSCSEAKSSSLCQTHTKKFKTHAGLAQPSHLCAVWNDDVMKLASSCKPKEKCDCARTLKHRYRKEKRDMASKRGRRGRIMPFSLAL